MSMEWIHARRREATARRRAAIEFNGAVSIEELHLSYPIELTIWFLRSSAERTATEPRTPAHTSRSIPPVLAQSDSGDREERCCEDVEAGHGKDGVPQ